MSHGTHEPVVLERSQHCISRRNIDPDAIKVLYRLNHCGFTAYLVGGGVRDLLLGRTPKDFDISTDAHPNQIRKLFRNCFLIGRRFRLAHIKFGDKVIETSTFRRIPDANADADTDEPGALLHYRDNTFGTPEEDALRRDFTINGLFYDISSFRVIDYVGGLADLQARCIRCIGDPDIRFREDPVRMLRAARFAGRLGFTIEPNTHRAILDHHGELALASRARLLEEIYRLFPYSASDATFRLLHQTRLMSVLFPEIEAHLAAGAAGEPPLWRYLAALDAGSRFAPKPSQALMLAVLYMPLFIERANSLPPSAHFGEWHEAARSVLQGLIQRHQLPRQISFETAWIMAVQGRLMSDTPPSEEPVPMPHRRRGPPRGQRRDRLARQPLFPQALALFDIHLRATGGHPSRLEPWVASVETAVPGGEPPVHEHAHAHAPHGVSEHDRPHRRRRSRGRRQGHPGDHGGQRHNSNAATPPSGKRIPFIDIIRNVFRSPSRDA
jgi:poly(A) polymerase